MDINKLARKNVLKLQPYQSARKIGGKGIIFLNANEYPISTNYTLCCKDINRYPTCQPDTVIKKYAKYINVETSQILVSRGADEGIELLMKTFCEPKKDTILICPPTYGMYKVTAETLNINYIEIPTDENWQPNLSAIQKQLKNIKLIYICNPNNPTGNVIHKNILQELLELTTINHKTLLILDEAYIDFYPHASLTKWIFKYPNLVILRTLSKAFALAGLRCGFTIAHPKIIKLLLKVISPYPIATPIATLAQKALNTKGIINTKKRINIINNIRKNFIKNLRNCPCIEKIFPSVTNYILVRCKPEYQVFETLWNQGIILRDQKQQSGLSNCLRITIGTHSECQQVITVLKKLTVHHITSFQEHIK